LGSDAWPASIASLISTLASALPAAVLHADAQRTFGIPLTPARVTEDVVGRIGAALTGRQHDRELRCRQSGWRIGQSGYLVEHFGHRQGDLVIRVRDQLEVVFVFVHRESDTRPALQDRLEERVAVGVSGAPHCFRVFHGRLLRQPPQRRRALEVCRQRRAERLVEDVREGSAHRGVAADGGEERLRVCLQAVLGGLTQRREVIVVDDAERPHQPRPDLRFGQRARQRLEERMP
jgi:hypothetical protein